MPGLAVEVESPLQDEVAARLYPGESRRPITPEALAQPGIHLVARQEAAVGCCALFDHGNGTAELKRMIVGEVARGQGVGVALLQGVEAVARRIGAHTVVLEVGVRNTEAQALYRRSGYGGAVAGVVEIGWWRSLWFVQRTMTGVGTPAETRPWKGVAQRRNRRHVAVCRRGLV